MAESIKDEKGEVLRMNMLQIQVCFDGSLEEALAWVREKCPAGTSNNWVKDERPEVAPIACADMPLRTHYIFTC